MQIMGELALIFGVCLAGEAIAALIPAAFPSSVVSLVLLMVLLLTGVVKERQIRTVSHCFVANMAFFFIPPFVGTLEYLELLRGHLPALLVIVGLTTPVIYLVAAWTVQLLMLRRSKKKEEKAP